MFLGLKAIPSARFLVTRKFSTTLCDILSDEHKHIVRFTYAVEQECLKAENGVPLNKQFFIKAKKISRD